MMISEEMLGYRANFGCVAGLVNSSAVFVEAVFRSSFSLSCILFVTAFALNHVNKAF